MERFPLHFDPLPLGLLFQYCRKRIEVRAETTIRVKMRYFVCETKRKDDQDLMSSGHADG